MTLRLAVIGPCMERHYAAGYIPTWSILIVISPETMSLLAFNEVAQNLDEHMATLLGLGQ